MAPVVPSVEVADDAYMAGVRSPYREADAGDVLVLDKVGSQFLVKTKVVSLAEEMEIEVGENRREPVGILDRDDGTIGLRHGQLVGEDFALAGEGGFEESVP